MSQRPVRRHLRVSFQDESGAILLIVLWVVVVLSVLAFGFAANVQMGARTIRNVKEGTTGYFLARAGVEESIYEMERFSQPGSDPQSALNFRQGRTAGLPISFDLGTGNAQCWIENESGKFDLNAGSPVLFRNLLVRQFDLNDADADAIVSQWTEWRKQISDSSGTVQGGPLDAVESLLALPAMKPEFIYGLWKRSDTGGIVHRRGLLDLTTIYTNSPLINVNDAPVEILQALPGVDPAEAQAIVNARSQHLFESIDDCQQRVPMQFNDLARNMVGLDESSTFTLIGSGRAVGTTIERNVRAVVRLRTNDPMGYRILYWKDEEI